MRIMAIQSNRLPNLPRANYSAITNNKPNLMLQNDSVSFKSDEYTSVWNREKLDILNRTDEQLDELGEYFYKSDPQEIEQASKIGGFWNGAHRSLEAKRLLTAAVERTNAKLKDTLDAIGKYTQKETEAAEEVVRVKKTLKNDFLSLLDADAQGLKVKHINNGIFIYGTNKDVHSDIINWLKEKTEPVAVWETLDFQPEHPDDSLNEVLKKAKKAKIVYENTGQRTVCEIKNLDKFLTNTEDEDNDILIDKFKGFVEGLSDRYNMTIVTSTVMDPYDFDEASLGSQRFETQVGMNKQLSEEDVNNLAELKAYVTRLENKFSFRECEFKIFTYYETKSAEQRQEEEEEKIRLDLELMNRT